MIAQLNALRALLDESGCAGYGAAIHDSYAFYRLMTMPDAAQIAAQPNVGDADDWQTDNIVADRAALGVPASAAAGTDTVYAGSFGGIYTHQRLYVDLVVESGACVHVTVNFSSDGVPAAAVAIHEKFGYADGLPAGRYTGYVNLEKWVPFGAVCGGTAVQVTGQRKPDDTGVPAGGCLSGRASRRYIHRHRWQYLPCHPGDGGCAGAGAAGGRYKRPA